MPSTLSLGLSELLGGRVESERLELKASGSEECIDAALRTICAFANDLHQRNGGYVVFGVEEEGGLAVLPPRGLDPANLDRLQKRIVDTIGRIEPVYAAALSVEEIDGRHILVVRCPPGENRPYTAPSRREKGDRLPFVRLGAETREARGPLALQLVEMTQRRSFDEQRAPVAGIGAVEASLVRRLLERAGSELVDEPLEQQLRNLDLLVGTNGGAQLRNAALLLFSANPARWFGGARVEITHFPDGRGGDGLDEQRLDGPLDALVEQALQRLMNLNPRRTRKPEGGLVATQILGWPEPALREVLVNALMHRGYEPRNDEPVRVDVEPGHIRVVSYPGPMPGISLEDINKGEVRQPPMRNRRVAAHFKEMGVAEARRSGLSKIRRAMERNGNPPPVFFFDEERTYFQVDLPIHPDLRPRPPAQGRPLRLGEPCPPAELLDRGPLIDKVVRALAHQSVALVGPEGRGVSSLIGGVLAALPADWLVLKLDGRQTTPNGLVQAVVARVEEEPNRFGDRREQIAAWDLNQRDPAAFLRDLVGKVPLLVVLDPFEEPDDHHLDDETLHEILALAGGLRLLVGSPLGGWLSQRFVSAHLRLEPVPPLGAAAGLRLATELLLGQGLSAELGPAVDAVAEGNPTLCARLVRELFIAGDGDVAGALEHLQDRQKDSLLRRLTEAGRSPYLVKVPRLDPLRALLATTPQGLPRAQIIATLAPSLGRAAVVTSLHEALCEGFVVEVDGLVRVEHALVREAWRAALPPPAPPSDDDIPF